MIGYRQQLLFMKHEELPLLTPLATPVDSARLVRFALSLGLVMQYTTFSLLQAHATRALCTPALLLASEVVKLTVSICIDRCTTPRPGMCSWLSFAMPGVIYYTVNVIALWCTARVSATLAYLLLQLKLPFTFLGTMMSLGVRVTETQIMALGIICLSTCAIALRRTSKLGDDVQSVAIAGLVLVSMLSGLSTVYMQHILGSSKNMWCDNAQLAAYGVVISALQMTVTDASCALRATPADIAMIALNSAGGLIVSGFFACNAGIEKCLATSVAGMLTMSLESIYCSNHAMDWSDRLVVCTSILATVQYNLIKV